MISRAPDVPTYIAEATDDRRPALKKLRALCRKTLPGAVEQIEYGMPVYKRGDTLEAAFASQKQFVALYLGRKEIVDEFKREFPGVKCGKGCIRFPKPEAIDFAAVERLLERNAKSKATPC